MNTCRPSRFTTPTWSICCRRSTATTRISISVGLSLVALIVILATQKRVGDFMDDQLAMSKRFHNSLKTFVPTAFLKQMGCRSIVDLHAGDRSEVALAMLFSDIR